MMRNIKRKMVFTSMALASITGAMGFNLFGNHFFSSNQYQQQFMGNVNQELIDKISSQTSNLNPKVLQLGLVAYEHARQQGLDKQHIITIIDYSAPSTEKRLWVIDLNRTKVLYNTLVAHGMNSGDDYARHFSNEPRSDETSIGVYLTGQTYDGEHGYSMKLYGLDNGFNNNAYERGIVMHSAWYVNEDMADKLGRIGRSWGCMALSQRVEPKVVSTIKNGTIILAYYPERSWLHSSRFLKPVTQST